MKQEKKPTGKFRCCGLFDFFDLGRITDREEKAELIKILWRRRIGEWWESARICGVSLSRLVPLCFLIPMAVVLAVMITGQNGVGGDTVEVLDSAPDRMVSVILQDGTSPAKRITTNAQTVEDLLREQGITLQGDDTVSFEPADSDPEQAVQTEAAQEVPLRTGMSITVNRIEKITVTRTEEIPFETEVVQVQTVPKGETVTVTAGEEGQRVCEILQTFCNGELAGEEILSAKVSREPITQVQNQGIGGWLTSEDGQLLAYSYYIDVSATAYGYDDDEEHITYSGIVCHKGTIATDPTVIPLGTKVYVCGFYGDYGICTAEDIGGGIKGNKIDIYMGRDFDAMNAFGVRQMRAYILEDQT